MVRRLLVAVRFACETLRYSTPEDYPVLGETVLLLSSSFRFFCQEQNKNKTPINQYRSTNSQFPVNVSTCCSYIVSLWMMVMAFVAVRSTEEQFRPKNLLWMEQFLAFGRVIVAGRLRCLPQKEKQVFFGEASAVDTILSQG
jgi:hypothetical protein